jgi:hypothetical protein
MDAVTTWTGSRADALRRALRMTNEAFAEHLGVAVPTVPYWNEQGDVVPRPAMQEILDADLAQSSAQDHAQFSLILTEDSETNQPVPYPRSTTLAISQLDNRSSTSDAAIDHRNKPSPQAKHARAPARDVLAGVIRIHRSANCSYAQEAAAPSRRLIRSTATSSPTPASC